MRRDNGYKKLHKQITQIIRWQNKSIENDDLWRGRFVIREKRFICAQYEDRSGWYGHVGLRIYDRKTGLYRDGWFSDLDITMSGWKLFWWINDFIVKDVDVWEEDPAPTKNDVDRKVNWRNIEPRALYRAGWPAFGEGD